MAEIHLVCGKICSGKSTYAKKLIREKNAVLLSCDEITLALFGRYIGEKHDEIVERTMGYLFKKSLEIYNAGTNVVLDFGFWQKDERKEAANFYLAHIIKPVWHYVDVRDDVWQENIKKRNADILRGKSDNYLVDENLAKKFNGMFEKPENEEVDVWYINSGKNA